MKASKVYEMHQNFREQYQKLKYKVGKLERKAIDYINEGPPLKLSEELKHYDFMFGPLLGNLPILKDQSVVNKLSDKI